MNTTSNYKFIIDFSVDKNAELFYYEYREFINEKIMHCLNLSNDGDHSNATIRFPILFINDFSITEMWLKVKEVNSSEIRFVLLENFY
jgi:hypothetical protein